MRLDPFAHHWDEQALGLDDQRELAWFHSIIILVYFGLI